MSHQFGLFDGEAQAVTYALAGTIRPANMRTTHGIRGEQDSRWRYSVSAVRCVEDALADDQFVRVSGGGMDAPEEMPVGSVKAFFRWQDSGLSGNDIAIGFCQRTTKRA
jgi:hypothetical protein